jgi:hypothetical protein
MATAPNLPMDDNSIRTRLIELDNKAYYLLVALSFLYRNNVTLALKVAITLTALVAVLPVQDWLRSPGALSTIRFLKVLLLAAALGCTLWWIWYAAA